MDSHEMSEMRLNKIIADAGITSRRGADELIMDGRVSVDGFTVRELGAKYDPDMVWKKPTLLNLMESCRPGSIRSC